MKLTSFLFILLFSSCSLLGKDGFSGDRVVASSGTMSCLGNITDFPRVKKYSLGEIDKSSIEVFDEELHVTQFFYGRPGVINRKRELRALSFEELQEFLSEKPIPYVAGADGKRYIIDRHHFSRSLFELKAEFFEKFGESTKELKVHFQKVEFDEVDPTELSERDFIQLLKENKLTYLKNANGNSSSFESLPDSISGLKQDYYRGLSWLVRKSGAFSKTDIPFAEFYWGEFLRNSLSLKKEDYSKKSLKKAIKAAIIMTDENKDLPGFKGASHLSDDEVKALVKKYLKKLKKKDLLNLEEVDF